MIFASEAERELYQSLGDLDKAQKVWIDLIQQGHDLHPPERFSHPIIAQSENYTPKHSTPGRKGIIAWVTAAFSSVWGQRAIVTKGVRAIFCREKDVPLFNNTSKSAIKPHLDWILKRNWSVIFGRLEFGNLRSETSRLARDRKGFYVSIKNGSRKKCAGRDKKAHGFRHRVKKRQKVCPLFSAFDTANAPIDTWDLCSIKWVRLQGHVSEGACRAFSKGFIFANSKNPAKIRKIRKIGFYPSWAQIYSWRQFFRQSCTIFTILSQFPKIPFVNYERYALSNDEASKGTKLWITSL